MAVTVGMKEALDAVRSVKSCGQYKQKNHQYTVRKGGAALQGMAMNEKEGL